MRVIYDLDPRAIEEEWKQAIGHAGIAFDDAAYWLTRETPEELRDVAAHYFAPGPNPDRPYAFSASQWKEATSPGFSGRHRIALHADYALPESLSEDCQRALIGGLLRHELEHARQTAAWGLDLFQIYDQFVHPAMGEFFGGSIPGVYVNSTPVELDANASASSYIREFHPGCVGSIEQSDNGNLVRSTQPPQPVKTLLSRTMCCLYVYRKPMEVVSGEVSVAGRLAVYSQKATEIWRDLVAAADQAEA